MQLNSFWSDNNCQFYSSTGSLKEQLALMIDELMPRLSPVWKSILLQDNQSQMMGAEVARSILLKQGRRDVRISLTKDEQNYYHPSQNLVGLSEQVFNSPSVVAIAIASHEVAHALNFTIETRLHNFLREVFVFSPLSVFGEFLLFFLGLIKPLWETCSMYKFAALIQSLRRHTLIQLLNLFLFRFVPCLIIAFTIIPSLLILFPISLLSICCTIVFRCLITLIELHTSWEALRLLRQHNILDAQERKAARKFLLKAALTYLGPFGGVRLL
jgi:Zn-dependent membrane protease YugP